MPQITKKYEAQTAPFYKNGVTLDVYTITFASVNLLTGAGVTANTDGSYTFKADTADYTGDAARNPVIVALEAIQARTSVEIIGTPAYAASNTTIKIAIAALGGTYPTDDYNKNGSPVDFATYLTSLVQNAYENTTTTAFQGFDPAGITVTQTAF